MKRNLLLILLALLPIVVSAYDAYIDGIYYDFYEDEATVASGDTKYNGDVVIPASVTYEGMTYSVTSIASNAFQSCSDLTSVKIPNSVTSIVERAFWLCSGLTSVTIPNSVTSIGNSAFSGCSSLTSVAIPNSVRTIGNNAFSSCRNLTSVTIGSGVTSIDRYAFNDCSRLQKVIVPDIAAWCGISFGSNPLYYAKHLYSDVNTEIKDLVIPEGVTDISQSAFANCSGLTSVTIPNSVTSISDYAFQSCSGMTSMTIGSSSIGFNAFMDCTGLTTVTILNSVANIGGNAFNNCSGLIKVIVPDIAAWCGISFDNERANPLSYAHHLYDSEETEITDLLIPESVTDISQSAFANCTSLIKVTIPNSVTSIGWGAFSGCFFASDSFVNNSSLTSDDNWGATICDEVTDDGLLIKDNIVVKCRPWATSVIIPESVTSIASNAFADCSSLTSVTFHCKKIDSWFSGNTIIKEVTIGNEVTSIVSKAFAGCYFASDSFVNNSSLKRSDNWGATLCDEETSDGVLIKNNVVIKCRPGATSATIPNSVTSIGNEAFNGCSSLTSVTIPESVTSIPGWAFYHCDNLNEIHISDIAAWCKIEFAENVFSPLHGYHLFLNDKEIKDLVIPDGVTKIGLCAFRSFIGLTSVTIPGSITSLSEGAFSRCSGLTSVNMLEGLTTIGDYAFDYCSSMTSITIPSSVTSIGKYAFQYSTGLTDVICYATRPPSCSPYNPFDGVNVGENSTLHVPGGYIKFYKDGYPWSKFNSIKPIDGLDNYAILDGICYAFSENDAEVSYAVDAYSGDAFIQESVNHNGKTYNVTSIGESAFRDCSGLTSVTIPNSVTRIESETFSGCTNLTSITIPNSVTEIGTWAFYNCSSLTDIVIPNSVTSIGYNAFYGCTALTSVTLESDAIVSATRTKDTSMKTVFGDQVQTYILGDAVTSIGKYTFYDCKSLTKVIIPTDVTSLEVYAFYGCKALTDVFCYAENVPAAKSSTFTNTPIASATLHVSSASLESYKMTSPWSKFGNIVPLTKDEEDGMGGLSPALFKGEGEVFDLNGRRVQQPRNGIFIKNGKKILIQ